jgi:alginate O-acetyltransferase complex protein AlgI
MLFNSIDFAIFLPLVFLLYWILKKNLPAQNILLLLASYFFYACWDYRFLALIVFSTLTDYLIGLRIKQSPSQKLKKIWLWISIIIGIGLLCFFKYFNFFAESFSQALSLLGIKINYGLIQVILPLGISFYTFHGLSYIIDIYKNRIEPEKNFVNYAVFVSFFPLLVAGPIERATHLLPQVKKPRVFDYAQAVSGLRQILWGLFKKVVIADNCADYANLLFSQYPVYSGSTLFIGVFFFAIQIYCDFSGYSDIAIGTARLFGIELLRNFSFPYFARSIPEFWRRWHISLTSWFRDYVYIPLGGSKKSTIITARNVFFVFLISGLWHGANWTFICWALLHWLYMLPSILFKKPGAFTPIVNDKKFISGLRDIPYIIFTFLLVCLAWVFFRAPTVSDALGYLQQLFTTRLFSIPEVRPYFLFALILFLLIVEWFGRKNQFALEHTMNNWFKPVRWSFYLLLTILIFISLGKEQAFIYFQF